MTNEVVRSDEARATQRRLRIRNLVLLGVLLALAALFYAISIVKFKVH